MDNVENLMDNVIRVKRRSICGSIERRNRHISYVMHKESPLRTKQEHIKMLADFYPKVLVVQHIEHDDYYAITGLNENE